MISFVNFHNANFPTKSEIKIPKYNTEILFLNREAKLSFCCCQKQFQYPCAMFYENTLIAAAYTLKLRAIDPSYLKETQTFEAY